VPYTEGASQGTPVRDIRTTQTPWLRRVIARNTGGELSPFVLTGCPLSRKGGDSHRQSVRGGAPSSLPFSTTNLSDSQPPIDEVRGRPVDARHPSVSKPHPPTLGRYPSTNDHFYSPSTTSRHPSLDRNFRKSRGSISLQSSHRSHSTGPTIDLIDCNPHSNLTASTSLQRHDRSGTPQTVIDCHPSVGHQLSVPAVAGVEQRRTGASQPVVGSTHMNARPIGTAQVIVTMFCTHDRAGRGDFWRFCFDGEPRHVCQIMKESNPTREGNELAYTPKLKLILCDSTKAFRSMKAW
jgi:hypothetical protein